MAHVPPRTSVPRRRQAGASAAATTGAQGWHTADEDEIARRRQRGAESGIAVHALEAEHGAFGTFRAESDKHGYLVEIRALSEPANTCDCPDFAVNGLGTCKHVEAVLHHLRRSPKVKAAQATSQRVEVYRDGRDGAVRVLWPQGLRAHAKAYALIAPFFSDDGTLLSEPLTAVPALRRAVDSAPAAARGRIRLSAHLEPWLETERHRRRRQQARRSFVADVAAGKQSLDVVSVPLYPYQQEGMLHLAFTGRALLADEMGLGKTVQAIAACELLRRLHGIRRVLVVSPASLKGEWEEQIAKFTALPSMIVQGPRGARLRQYRQESFFYLTNYEQVLPDYRDINQTLAPDVVILDEAQRIKNWRTRTAESVKRLASPYAFVLTGTPLENRIDEVYSIVQFLDPAIFGPLFRFNREFYELDEKGRATGYKNLDRMHQRLRPVMLRRRKDEVEGQLPARSVNTYFVDMHPEQALRYEEYAATVARLAATARRRPLTPKEMEQLQRSLACMRMLCDTPYILDAECRVSPKLAELETILGELMEDGDHKVIIFSEWERMLELVRELATRMEVGFAWHTGSVPQIRRRTEIKRFKQDPACRLFLSTDSGSVGLNLQAANVVINLDQPWNPAKLEQRIARAWRKHQTRNVQVINLVTEHSIEHRIVHLLEQKRALAAGVVDGAPETTSMKLPSGRAAFLERVQSLVGEAPPPRPARRAPQETLREDVLSRWSSRLDLLAVQPSGDGHGPTVLAVADRIDEDLRASLAGEVSRSYPDPALRLELLDRQTYETILRLAEAGVIRINEAERAVLHESPTLTRHSAGERERRLSRARKAFEDAQRKQRMATVLAEGGFAVEASIPLREAVEAAVGAAAGLLADSPSPGLPAAPMIARLAEQDHIPANTPAVVERLKQATGTATDQITELLATGHGIVDHVARSLGMGG